MATNAPRTIKLPASLNHYPDTGFRTMASLKHDRARQTVLSLLIDLFAPASLVAGELPVMFDETDHRRHLSPDIMVALGMGEDDPVFEGSRKQYRIWDEGKPPDLVIELASPSTVERDSAGKKEDYAVMGVREYVQFDPTGEMLDPRLRLFRLDRGRYLPVPLNADGSAPSVVLTGYAWIRWGSQLRLIEHDSGRLIPTPEERADAEVRRADAEARRADRETSRADREETGRKAEAERADAAEEELRQLRAELARMRADAARTSPPTTDSQPG